MKVKIYHKIYDRCGLKFINDYRFQTKREAIEELRRIYMGLNSGEIIDKFNKTTLIYHNEKEKTFYELIERYDVL